MISYAHMDLFLTDQLFTNTEGTYTSNAYKHVF